MTRPLTDTEAKVIWGICVGGGSILIISIGIRVILEVVHTANVGAIAAISLGFLWGICLILLFFWLKGNSEGGTK